MKIIGQVVKHRAFGIGVVNAQQGDYITVHFTSGHKDFVYPQVFARYLTFTDQNLQEEILKQLNQMNAQPAEDVKESGFLSMCTPAGDTNAESAPHNAIKNCLRRRYRRSVDPEAGNLAFKCVFCDGGRNNERLGFFGPCSPALVAHNVDKSKHNRCRLHTSYCLDFKEGRIPYNELMEAWSNNQLTCESSLFVHWQMTTGLRRRNETDDVTPRFRTQVGGKLGILTTRQPRQTEAERMIFAICLIDEDTDDQKDFATIPAHPRYRLSFSEAEASQLLYWNYHKNINAAETATWGTGIYRYLPDHEALVILWDAVRLKAGGAEASLAAEFLDYYCEINHMDPLDIPEPGGALTF